MKRQAIVTLSLITFLLMFGCSSEKQKADLVIRGKIYTMDAENPVAEAVAVSSNRIIFVGSREDVESYLSEKTKVVNLNGYVMTPGLIESHAHMLEVGYNEQNIDLLDTKSYDEMIERVQAAVAKAKPGQWIVGRGWHQDKWDVKPEKLVKGFQTHEALSKVSPDNPVFLSHASGHTGLANARAMQIAGVNQLSTERQELSNPEGGEILMDELGNPTGIFSENAMRLIEKHIPERDAASDAEALGLALDVCLRNGITGFHDAGVPQSTLDLYEAFKRNGKLSVRIYAMLTHNDSLLKTWYARGPLIDSLHWFTVRSIKLYGDGALGSRGAWLLKAYDDRPDFHGMATISMDTVLAVAQQGLANGFQVCTHAIGDRANHEVLNRYEEAFSKFPGQRDHRFRIEHAQHLDPKDIPRFAKLGVIPSMQAIHMSSDRPWAIDRLGEKRINDGAYMWQSLIRSGATLINGTDAPVEPINPIACFYASVTRKTLEGTPAGGFEPKERMTREQALMSYTKNPAYAAFQEKDKGMIKLGMLADFTVFSKDIMTIDEEEILSTEVTMTVIDGRIAWEKK